MAARDPEVKNGKSTIEPIKDSLLSMWFGNTCGGEKLLSEFDSAMVEKNVGAGHKKILVDPSRFSLADLSLERLRSDIQRLARLIDENPAGFELLAESVGDAKAFREQARILGLREPEFLSEGGGWGWLIVVPIALLLSGCGDQEDEVVNSSSLPCDQRTTGMSLDDGNGGGKVWSIRTFTSPPGGTAADTPEFLEWKAMVSLEIPRRLDALLSLAECGEGCSPYWDPEPSHSIKLILDMGETEKYEAVMGAPITVKCE